MHASEGPAIMSFPYYTFPTPTSWATADSLDFGISGPILQSGDGLVAANQRGLDTGLRLRPVGILTRLSAGNHVAPSAAGGPAVKRPRQASDRQDRLDGPGRLEEEVRRMLGPDHDPGGGGRLAVVGPGSGPEGAAAEQKMAGAGAGLLCCMPFGPDHSELQLLEVSRSTRPGSGQGLGTSHTVHSWSARIAGRAVWGRERGGIRQVEAAPPPPASWLTSILAEASGPDPVWLGVRSRSHVGLSRVRADRAGAGPTLDAAYGGDT